MSAFKSPKVLGQLVPDLSKTVIVKIIGKNTTPVVKIVPMPGVKGDTGPMGPQGPQGVPGNLATVTFVGGLAYNATTNTLSITNIDAGAI